MRLGGVKIVLTDDIREPYPDQEKLNLQVLAVHKPGLQVAMHAVQQESVEAAITALEYAQGRRPGEGCATASSIAPNARRPCRTG